jgi:ATP-dependent DNA ligase
VQQCQAEVEAMYEKRIKHEGYRYSLDDIDQEDYFHPMLAKHLDDYTDSIRWSDGVGVQIKFNGHRIIARKEGLFSRKGEKIWSAPHIFNALIPFFAKYPQAILDGEGFNFDLREKLNELSKLLRKRVNITENDLHYSAAMVEYHIYDGAITPEDFDRSYDCRNEFLYTGLELYCPGFGTRTSPLKKVQTNICNSRLQFDDLYQTYLKDGHEGAMVRILDAPYVNHRTSKLLKYKPVMDGEYEITDINTGTGNWSGVAKIISCRDRSTGKTFDATFKGTMEEAADCWQQRSQLLHKTVTIYYFGFTGKGTPNFAQFDWQNFNK